MTRPCGCGRWIEASCLRVLEGHTGSRLERGVELPTASAALSGADDGTMRLWAVESGPVLTCGCSKAMSRSVWSVAFASGRQDAALSGSR